MTVEFKQRFHWYIMVKPSSCLIEACSAVDPFLEEEGWEKPKIGLLG